VVVRFRFFVASYVRLACGLWIAFSSPTLFLLYVLLLIDKSLAAGFDGSDLGVRRPTVRLLRYGGRLLEEGESSYLYPASSFWAL
jgi:hypothetical protein